MRDYSIVVPRFWTGETGKILRGSGAREQLLALYLVTAPHANMIGLYHLPISTIANDVAIPARVVPLSLEVLSRSGFAHYDCPTETVWVPEMARMQIEPRLHPRDKRVVMVVRLLRQMSVSPFFSRFLERYQVPFSLPDEDTILRDDRRPKKSGAQRRQEARRAPWNGGGAPKGAPKGAPMGRRRGAEGAPKPGSGSGSATTATTRAREGVGDETPGGDPVAVADRVSAPDYDPIAAGDCQQCGVGPQVLDGRCLDCARPRPRLVPPQPTQEAL